MLMTPRAQAKKLCGSSEMRLKPHPEKLIWASASGCFGAWGCCRDYGLLGFLSGWSPGSNSGRRDCPGSALAVAGAFAGEEMAFSFSFRRCRQQTQILKLKLRPTLSNVNVNTDLQIPSCLNFADLLSFPAMIGSFGAASLSACACQRSTCPTE